MSNNTGIDAAGVLVKEGYQEQRSGRFEEPLRYTIVKFGGRDYIFISAEINILERSHILSLARDVTKAMDAVRELALECALAGAGVILLAAAAVWLLTRRSLKPIGALEQGASEIAAGSYERRISVKGAGRSCQAGGTVQPYGGGDLRKDTPARRNGGAAEAVYRWSVPRAENARNVDFGAVGNAAPAGTFRKRTSGAPSNASTIKAPGWNGSRPN